MEDILTPPFVYSSPDSQNYNSGPSQDLENNDILGRLFDLTGNLAYYVFTTKDKVITCGRLGGNIPINEKNMDSTYLPSVSKCHFKISRSETDSRSLVLEDCSTNGTFVNHKKVGKNKKVTLKSNDIISLLRPNDDYFFFVESKSCGLDVALPNYLKRKYVVYKIIGSGSYGDVFHIFEKDTGIPFALKRLKMAAGNSSKVHQEAKILESVKHMGIIKLNHVINDESATFFILELMRGGDLFQKIKDAAKLQEGIAKVIFYQISLALKYLHDKGISHRDLKPENILLSSKDDLCVVKIADFGLSRFVDSHSFMSTHCGSPLYAAPEMFHYPEENVYTKKVDVWSLGVILYVALSGTPPFPSGKNAMIKAIISGHYNFPKKYWEGVSLEAIDLIKRMLVVDSQERIDCDGILKHSWFNDSNMLQDYETLVGSKLVGTQIITEVDLEEQEELSRTSEEIAEVKRKTMSSDECDEDNVTRLSNGFKRIKTEDGV